MYRDDDYVMFEMQITLAENYEKCDDQEQADTLFNEVFTSMDGRDNQSQLSMSIRSKLSRAISIRSKNTSIVQYGGAKLRKVDDPSPGREKAGVMQRVAVQLRQKQEYGRAEKLMIKAIHLKKQLVGSEAHEDIAYLYNELAVTYHSNEDLENAIKCVKKQLAIYDHLEKSNTMEYAQICCFLGELHRDLEQPTEAIDALKKAIELHEQVYEATTVDEGDEEAKAEKDQLVLERTGIIKILAEEQVKA